MNLCECGLDFGSLKAFDRHRVGTFDYMFREGLRMEPPRLDGRRCLDEPEIEALRDVRGRPVFARNAKGRWSLATDVRGASEATRRLRGAA